jgi:DNA-binding beta-propeller fold protein YncE
MRLSHTKFTFLLVILFLLISLPVIAQEEWTESEPLTLVWQTEFTPDAAIVTPSDLVVDHEGSVYVSTQADKNIKKFDRDGNFVTHWGGRGGGEGKFSLSSGIAVDTEGNVYVADFMNVRIQKFDSDGNFLLQWRTAPPMGPASIVVDEWGYAYVDNFFIHEHYISKFDPTGQIVAAWGTTGSEEGQFKATGQSGPEDITLDSDGNVYVADRLNHRIQKFDSDGNFLAAFGGERNVNGGGQFDEPMGIAVDEDGNLYVIDQNFLQILDSEGRPLEQWSTDGGDLDAAGIIALDGEANIYVFAKTDVIAVNGSPTRAYVIKKFQQVWE